MQFYLNKSLKVIEIVLIVIILSLYNVLSEVLSDSLTHKIETSHSNSIPSFDDSIYYTINWLDAHQHQHSQHQHNDPKVIAI